MSNYGPYSFSRLNTHAKCPRRFRYQYIDRVKREPTDMTALLKGGALHSILENYPARSTHKLAPRYQAIADAFTGSVLGRKYLGYQSMREIRFGMDGDLAPCEYGAPTAIFRGFIDYTCVIDGVLHLLDWKSGKLKDQKYQHFEQLMFYAIYFFQKYPALDKINIGYVYIEHAGCENSLLLERQYLPNYVEQLRGMIRAAENDTTFIKNPSRLCDWCPYQRHCGET